MKHYIVINEWTDGMSFDTNYLGVYSGFDAAHEKFLQILDEEREYANERKYEIYENNDWCFDAGFPGDYVGQHSRLWIEEVCNDDEDSSTTEFVF